MSDVTLIAMTDADWQVAIGEALEFARGRVEGVEVPWPGA